MVSSADSARGCIALTEARRLATWVGDGRRVTPKGFLRPADVPAAAEASGVPGPPRRRSWRSGPRLEKRRSEPGRGRACPRFRDMLGRGEHIATAKIATAS